MGTQSLKLSPYTTGGIHSVKFNGNYVSQVNFNIKPGNNMKSSWASSVASRIDIRSDLSGFFGNKNFWSRPTKLLYGIYFWESQEGQPSRVTYWDKFPRYRHNIATYSPAINIVLQNFSKTEYQSITGKSPLPTIKISSNNQVKDFTNLSDGVTTCDRWNYMGPGTPTGGHGKNRVAQKLVTVNSCEPKKPDVNMNFAIADEHQYGKRQGPMNRVVNFEQPTVYVHGSITIPGYEKYGAWGYNLTKYYKSTLERWNGSLGLYVWKNSFTTDAEAEITVEITKNNAVFSANNSKKITVRGFHVPNQTYLSKLDADRKKWMDGAIGNSFIFSTVSIKNWSLGAFELQITSKNPLYKFDYGTSSTGGTYCTQKLEFNIL